MDFYQVNGLQFAIIIMGGGKKNTSIDQLLYEPLCRPVTSNGPIVIGKNVWCGEKATILSGVTIGDGAIIGANSVVTKDVPPFSIAAGSPAKVIYSIRSNSDSNMVPNKKEPSKD